MQTFVLIATFQKSQLFTDIVFETKKHYNRVNIQMYVILTMYPEWKVAK